MNESTVQILAWNADLSFSSFGTRGTEPAELDGLKMVNGTLSSGNGIDIKGDAWIFGSSICGCDYLQTDVDNLNKTIVPFTVSQKLFFGAPNISFFDDLFPDDYPLLKSFFEDFSFEGELPIHVDKLQLRVVGMLIVTIPSIRLNNTASLMIMDEGTLFVDSPTTILNEEKDASHVSL
jgi:hypothetical protein